MQYAQNDKFRHTPGSRQVLRFQHDLEETVEDLRRQPESSTEVLHLRISLTFDLDSREGRVVVLLIE